MVFQLFALAIKHTEQTQLLQTIQIVPKEWTMRSIRKYYKETRRQNITRRQLYHLVVGKLIAFLYVYSVYNKEAV